MLLYIFQTGTEVMEKYLPVIITISSLVGAFLLLKLGLTIVKADKRTRIKWVGYSFLIQFGVIFAIGSPLMLLGFAGEYKGDPIGMLPIIIIAMIIDLNVINVIHQVGLKRSLIVILMIIVPIIFAMRYLGELIATIQYM